MISQSRIPALVLVGAVLLPSGPALGAPDDDEPSIDVDALAEVQRRPRAEATLGVWFPRLEGTVTLGEGGTGLDVGDDLSADDSETMFNAEVQFEFDRLQVIVGGYRLTAGGNGALRQASLVEGSLLPAGTRVNSTIDVWSISTEVDYAIYTPFRPRRLPWSDPTSPPPRGDIDLVLQAVGGMRVINLDQRYDFEGYDVVASDRAWFCPYLGIGCEVDWSTRRAIGFLDRLAFDVTAAFGPAFEGGDSTMLVRADLTVYVTRNLGLTLGYRLNDWDLSRDGDTFGEGGLQGLYAGVRLAW
ncbi:MAG: hypothetical protein VX672_08715 [Planctomycetota bacterium]|nr:hypothetical protein [Planctomycetota bacterium]